MIEQFQCPGCVNGLSPDTCGQYAPDVAYGARCVNHVLGTTITAAIAFALGLPKGFNRSTLDFSGPPPVTRNHNRIEIRLWQAGDAPLWNDYNVPVWAMEQDGFLFVRTLSPRVARLYTDVIEGGTLAMTPNAIDVSKFYDDMD